MTNPFRALFERRNGPIGSSHDLWTYLSRGVMSSSGATVTENSAMNVAVVRQCVALISRTVMTLPVDVRERTGGDTSRPAVPTHPLVRLFENPNTWQIWPLFVQMLQSHLLLRGNAFAWVNWVRMGDTEVASEMIPIHPDQIRVEQGDWPSGQLKYTLTKKNGAQIVLPADEVMHLRGLTTNGYMGRCPLTDLRDTIGDALSTQQFSSNFWKRDATPPLALRHPKTLSEKAQKGLEEKWEATYGGKDGRRVAVLEEGMEIQQLAFNAEQSQFLETRKFQRSELAGEFFVPPHMLGDTEKSTSWGTGIEQQKLGYLTFTIQPWLTVWESSIRKYLIKNEGRFYVKFKVEGLLRGDANARATFYERMWRMGAFSINQILALEDQNPVEDGDVRFVPANYVTLERAVAGQVSEGAQASAAMTEATAALSELLSRLRAADQAA